MRLRLLISAVAFLNAFLFAVLTPYGQVPDEQVHLGYAEYVLATGEPPAGESDVAIASDANGIALTASDVPGVIGNPLAKVPAYRSVDRALDRELAENGLGPSKGGATQATNNPPAYYYLAATAAWIAPGNYLDDVFAMRLTSAALWGITTFFVAGFLLLLVPATPWAAAIGALAVALQPQAAFLSGGVTSDAAVYATGSALLWAMAHAFRRGLNVRSGLGIGLALGFGAVSKLITLSLAPGVALGLLMLVAVSGERRRAVLGAGVAILVPTLFLGGWVVAAEVLDRPLLLGGDPSASTSADGTAASSLSERLSYVWRFYLPALPFMTSDLGGWGVYDPFFVGFVGRFGWLDYGFAGWVYDVALGVAVILMVGAVITLVRRAKSPSSKLWLGELVTYAVMLMGLCVVVGLVSANSLAVFGVKFEQVRYLFPLIALYGAVVSLAARGLGRLAGTAFVFLALAHSLGAHLQTVARYYG